MKIKLFKSIILVLFLTAAFQTARAQTTEFTYQGSLNNNGAPANGNFDFQFALFDAVGNPASLGVVVSNVPVTNGIFSVNLNFGNQFPGALRFLEIRVRQSGGAEFTTLTPRQLFTSSPYSVKSQNADSLGGIAASSYVLSGAASINAATQFNIAGNRILSAGGTDNTFVGFGAGDANTGADNSFFGRRAGQFNTTGSQNAFFGEEAGFNNTVGGSNSFFGENSGNANTNGSANSFFGRSAGRNNTTASTNSFFGSDSGFANTTGFQNSFFGEGAGIANTTGGDNSFFGRRSGRSNTNGNSNSFFGIFSGDSNTTGSRNVFIGSGAGFSNTTGSNNVIIGPDANVGAGNLTNAIAIGNRAFVTQSNSLILGSIANINGGSSNTNVGIGTTAPINRLTIGQPETPVVNASMGIFNAGSAFLIVRDTTNDIEGLFGADSNGVIFGSMTNSRVQFRTDNTTRMTISDEGDVNIGGLPGQPQKQLYVNGRISLAGFGDDGNFALCYSTATRFISHCSSSIRYKTDIRSFTPGLNLIRRLQPVSFIWKNSGMPDMGLVAEEVAAVEPLLTTTNEKGEIEGVKYDRVGVVLVNAVNEQQQLIEAQQRKIETLKLKLLELDAIKQLVCLQNKTAAICQPENK